MDSVIISTSNHKLVINKPTVTEAIETQQIDVAQDIYVNSGLYTPVGSILSYAGTSVPTGWLFCDGSEVSKTTYSRLFNVIGTLYGTSSDSSKFVLPNLADRVLVGKTNSNSVGNSGGSSTITLSTDQLPSHTHTGTSDLSGSHTHIGTTDLSGVHSHTGTSDSSGSHAHTGTVDSAGSHTHSINDPGHTHIQTTINDDYNNSGGNSYPNQNNPSFAGYDSSGSKLWYNVNSSTTGITINSAGAHQHTFTSDSNGSHQHSFTTQNSSTHAHEFTTQSSGSHAHTFTTNSTGGGNEIDIRNKYIVINYIIRF